MEKRMTEDEFKLDCEEIIQSICMELGHDAALHVTFVHNDPDPDKNPQLRFDIEGYHYDVYQEMVDKKGGFGSILYALISIHSQIVYAVDHAGNES